MKTYKLTPALRKYLKTIGYQAPKEAYQVRLGGFAPPKRFKAIA